MRAAVLTRKLWLVINDLAALIPCEDDFQDADERMNKVSEGAAAAAKFLENAKTLLAGKRAAAKGFTEKVAAGCLDWPVPSTRPRKTKEEAERKAMEEAERQAKEEAERKGKEVAEAKEEAKRKAKEEAERRAKEEAEDPCATEASDDSEDFVGPEGQFQCEECGFVNHSLNTYVMLGAMEPEGRYHCYCCDSDCMTWCFTACSEAEKKGGGREESKGRNRTQN